jgi:hypothetical protein
MNHLAKTAHQAHAAHKAHVAKLKSKNNASHLTAHDKAELAKLSPTQRSALKKLTPQQRATLHHMTPAQRAKLSHLTQAEKTALSHLSPRQKETLAKATAASAKKRHTAAVTRRSAAPPKPAHHHKVAKSKASASHVTPVAAGKLHALSQHSALDGDQDGEFLEHDDVKMAVDSIEHHGVKGQKWGVRKARSVVGTGVNKAVGYAIEHPYKTAIAVRGAQVAYRHRAQIADFGVKAVGTAKIIAHIVKVLNEQRNSPQGQEALALGRAFVQGQVIHADGSLEHHGIKGMHWGVRHTRAERAKQYVAQAQAHEEHSKAHSTIAINAAHHYDEVVSKGTHSKAFRAAYGSDAHKISHEQFQARHGITKEEGVQRAKHDLRVINNAYGRSAILHTQSATRLRAKAARLQHDGLDDEVGEFLEHHGIKGMKWGVRRNGGHPGRDEAHPVSADAQKAHIVAETAHRHGTAALSNEDLQHLVNRQRLLQQHAQLNPADPSNVRKGLDFVKTLTNDTKTVIDAVDTGRRAVKTFNGLASERPPPRQRRRKRNAPLKVVDVRAA